jgi:hypothetical protein
MNNYINEVTRRSIGCAYRVHAWLPVWRVAHVVHGPDESQERVSRRLSDAFVIMIQELDEGVSATLEMRQVVILGGSEESAHRVCGNFLLDSNSATRLKHAVGVEIFDVNFDRLVCSSYDNSVRA